MQDNKDALIDKNDWLRPENEMHGNQVSCPKCGLEFKEMLHPFCQHKECPVRNYANQYINHK